MQHDTFDILPITLNSKKVGPGSIFVAIQGARDDGVNYIPEAVQLGACEIMVADSVTLEESVMELIAQRGVKLTRVKHTRKALAERAAEVHGYPARQLHCIGITGTKGKTTTSWLTHHLLMKAGYRTALLSTVENRMGDKRYPTELTTQQPDYIHAFLRACVDDGVTHVVIEVAAQALTQYRVLGISFSEVAWLNFSQEHGEFYASERDYWNAKLTLFEYVAPGGTIIIPEHDPRFATIPIRSEVMYRTWRPHLKSSTPSVSCVYEGIEYRCPHLLGEHNSANLLVAVMLAHAAGASRESMQCSLESFSGIPGRPKHSLPKRL